MQQIHGTLQGVIGTLNIKLGVGCSPTPPTLPWTRQDFFFQAVPGRAIESRSC